MNINSLLSKLKFHKSFSPHILLLRLEIKGKTLFEVARKYSRVASSKNQSFINALKKKASRLGTKKLLTLIALAVFVSQLIINNNNKGVYGSDVTD